MLAFADALKLALERDRGNMLKRQIRVSEIRDFSKCLELCLDRDRADVAMTALSLARLSINLLPRVVELCLERDRAEVVKKSIHMIYNNEDVIKNLVALCLERDRADVLKAIMRQFPQTHAVDHIAVGLCLARDRGDVSSALFDSQEERLRNLQSSKPKTANQQPTESPLSSYAESWLSQFRPVATETKTKDGVDAVVEVMRALQNHEIPIPNAPVIVVNDNLLPPPPPYSENDQPSAKAASLPEMVVFHAPVPNLFQNNKAETPVIPNIDMDLLEEEPCAHDERIWLGQDPKVADYCSYWMVAPSCSKCTCVSQLCVGTCKGCAYHQRWHLFARAGCRHCPQKFLATQVLDYCNVDEKMLSEIRAFIQNQTANSKLWRFNELQKDGGGVVRGHCPHPREALKVLESSQTTVEPKPYVYNTDAFTEQVPLLKRSKTRAFGSATCVLCEETNLPVVNYGTAQFRDQKKVVAWTGWQLHVAYKSK